MELLFLIPFTYLCIYLCIKASFQQKPRPEQEAVCLGRIFPKRRIAGGVRPAQQGQHSSHRAGCFRAELCSGWALFAGLHASIPIPSLVCLSAPARAPKSIQRASCTRPALVTILSHLPSQAANLPSVPNQLSSPP